MYGPPPDPREVAVAAGLLDDPAGLALCLLVGVALSLGWWWRRPPLALRALLLILGQTVLLTTPMLAQIDRSWIGAFPTIDKEGSLLFYLDGVHVRLLLHPLASAADPAARLIGVHVGHLWVTALFDLGLSPMGAFNAQALLYPALGWWCAWLLLRDVCGDERVALLMAMPFGLGLHVFRDLNWYTIEKAAVFWLALYAWSLYRAWRVGGRSTLLVPLIYLLGAWMNLYMGLVGAALGGLALLGVGIDAVRQRGWTPGLRRVLWATVGCALVGLPLAAWQGLLMSGAGASLGTPEQFLWERAALDGFSLWPLRWNRLEVWRALDPAALSLALVGLVINRRDPRVRFAGAAGLVLFLLSIGPVLWPTGPLENPLYSLMRMVVPGFWRVAKPEVFFEGTWLLLLCVAAVELARRRPGPRALLLLYGMMVVGWVALVRDHPVYPGFSAPIDATLAPGWEQRVFH